MALFDQLVDAIRNENNEDVSELLGRLDLETVNGTERGGWSPLHVACITNNSYDVTALLAMDGIQVNTRNNDGETAIMLAAEFSSVEALRLMVGDPRVDIDVRSRDGDVLEEFVGYSKASEERKNTCLEIIREERRKRAMFDQVIAAIRSNNNGKVSELLERLDVDGIQVNGTNSSGWSPLHWACNKNNSHAVAALLAMDGIQVNARDNNGHTPIVSAAVNSHVEALRLMVGDPRVDIHVKDMDGRGLEEVVDYGRLSEERNTNTCIEILREERRKRENPEMWQNVNEDSLEETFRAMHLDPLSEARLESLKEKQELEKKTLDLESSQRIMKIENQKSVLEQQLAVLKQSLDEMKQLKKTNEKEMKKKHDDELVTLTNNLKKQSQELEVENDDSSNLKDARETLECPVCMDPMKPPTRIWMCSASHLICEQCRNKMDGRPGRQCPTCRTKKVNLRAFMAEKFAQTVFNKYSSKI